MKKIKLLLILLILLNPATASSNNDINKYFQKIKHHPKLLYDFLKNMPKGGELHYHLTGGAYAENILLYLKDKDFCIDKKFRIFESNKCKGYKIKEVLNDPHLYEKTIEAWSMKNFKPINESGHDHFFNYFLKIDSIVENDFLISILAEEMKRASEQHENYLEILLSPDNNAIVRFGNNLNWTKGMEFNFNELKNNKKFESYIKRLHKISLKLLSGARENLGCSSNSNNNACSLKIKFIYNIMREQEAQKLFAQAVGAFELCSKYSEFAGIDLVQPEDGYIALHDYKKQMYILNFLHKKFPTVHISLHAGELKHGLTNHISKAVHIAHAERIGHGVDIKDEANYQKLLEYMSKNKIAVEINLTSNHVILGTNDKNHPFSIYFSNNVPITLSTDDEGILRTTLTMEYQKAVLAYNLTYQQLKDIDRNSLTYSFLPGKNIWKNQRLNIPIDDCRHDIIGSKDLTADCKKFLSTNEKATLQWKLEGDFNKFEHNMREIVDYHWRIRL